MDGQTPTYETEACNTRGRVIEKIRALSSFRMRPMCRPYGRSTITADRSVGPTALF